MAQNQGSAEATALEVLAWLAANSEILPVFQNSTGLSDEDIRSGVRDPVFLGMVLDFVLMDDAWVIDACDACGLEYDAVAAARVALPGGDAGHWT
ncbi:MAG: DUF3572 domain-containing protein [Pseudomonadota bacterium]